MQIRQAARSAFLRYRDRGEMAALAEVFDLVAQELLLVASHLANRRDSAEDLVQETFVVAIRNAHAFDASRPLEPWLLGILANLARNAHRKSARSITLPVGIDAAGAACDPAETAAAREFVASLHASLERMPRHLREVLTLHLVHHMTPTEIAHAKGRPVGTIKSWVHRGLRDLRRLLPAGHGLALASLARASTPLAVLREHTLAAAAAAVHATASSSSAATTASAAVRVHRFPAGAVLAATVGAFAIVCGMWWMGRSDAAPPLQDRAAHHAATEATQPGTRHGADHGAGPAASERVLAGTAATVLHIATRREGLPLSVTGFVEPRVQPDPILRRRWFATDDRGLAVLPDLTPGPWLLTTDRGTTAALELQAGERLVEVAIPTGVRLAGIVVTTNDTVVAGAGIWLSRSPTTGDGFRLATSDASGRFEVLHAPGDHYVSAFAPGWRAARLQPVSAASPPSPLRFVLDEPAATVMLSVTDAAGETIVGATVQVGQQPALLALDGDCAARPAWSARTDTNGHATCAHVAIDEPVWVCARAPDRCAVEAWVRIGAGETVQHTLSLPTGASCDGTIAAIGAAGGDTRITAHVPDLAAQRGFPAPPWVEPSAIAAADGSYRLTGMAGGTTLLRAANGRHFAERLLEFEPDLAIPWSPRLGPGISLTGTAVAWPGVPMAGYTVIAAPPHGPTHRATVDASGRFRIDGLGDVDHEVRLCDSAALVGNTLASRAGVRPGSEVVFQLDATETPSAFVCGRIGTVGDARTVQVSLIGRTERRDHTVACAADGTFRIGPVEPGRYHWFATADAVWAHRELHLDAAAELDLGVVDQQPPWTLELALAAAEVPTPSHVYLWTPDGTAVLALAAFEAGRADLLAPPGRYELRLTRAGAVLGRQMVDLQFDRQPVAVQPVHPRAVEVRLAASPPGPVPSLAAQWSLHGSGEPWTFFGDRPHRAAAADPVVVRVWLAPGNYRVACRTVHGAGSAEFRVPLSPGASVPTIQLGGDR